MGIKTGAMSLSNIIDEKAAKSAKNEEEEGYVTLYRGTTYTRAKEYRDTEDIATKCKLLITPNAGQFHIKGELAAYFTPQRELAEYYALSAAKWENDEGQLKHSEECDPDSQILDGDLSCDFEPEIGGILTFQVPLRCFVGSVIWDRDCEAWAEVCLCSGFYHILPSPFFAVNASKPYPASNTIPLLHSSKSEF